MRRFLFVAATPVWQDYVAGTDPTNALSKFTVKIEMKDGAPVVAWSPAFNGEGVVAGGVTIANSFCFFGIILAACGISKEECKREWAG